MGWLAYLLLNPLGRPAPYTAKVISLKAKEIQSACPQRHRRCSHCLLLCTSPHRLDNSHYGSNFSRLHLGGKKKLSQLYHSDSPGCCICHPLTNWTCSLRAGDLRRNDVKSALSGARNPKPAPICFGLWRCPWLWACTISKSAVIIYYRLC